MAEQEVELSSGPVFYDEKGRRGRVFHYVALLFAMATSVMVTIFAVSVIVDPSMPPVRLRPTTVLAAPVDMPHKSGRPAERPQRKPRSAAEIQQDAFDRTAAEHELAEASVSTVGVPDQKPAGRPLSIGFYVNWDDSSLTSLKHHINKMDWLVPEWIRLSGDEGDPLVLDVDIAALDLIAREKPGMPVLPLLQNYKNEQWNSDILVTSISSPAARRRLIDSLLETIDKYKFHGLTIDIEEVPAASQVNLYQFMRELHGEFQGRGLILAQAVPFDNPDWNYRAYAAVNDYLMLMAYDQHWSTGEAGPVSGQDWFAEVLKRRMAELSPAKTIVCIGNYGYTWTHDGAEAETVTFQEALLVAKNTPAGPASIKFDDASKNPKIEYSDEDGKPRTVWFLDAVTAYGELQSAKPYQVAGFALWRLGSEDPSLWNVFGSDVKELSTDGLRSIKYGYDVDFTGTGEILQVLAKPRDGERDLQTGNGGEISREDYLQIPSSYVIMRTGDKPGKIALTFDDGPDPVWTPKILEILKRENIKAAFFIVGENGQANPELVKQIVADGHEIGNHSFTHPNLGEVPRRLMDLELNTTQRLIESLTGRSTRLFRAPYFGDAEPRTPDEVDPTSQAQDLGYISVGLHLDPDDWRALNEDGSRHTADQMVAQVLEQAAIKTPEERGNIVLMHDGGGDRSATVEALSKLIPELRNRGHEFTSISDLANITTDVAMPRIPEDRTLYPSADAYVFYGMSAFGWFIKWLFLVGIALGIGRIIFIGVLAFVQFRRSRHPAQRCFADGEYPLVSVIVPAFNEAKVIAQTLDSLAGSDYPNFEIVVVDDGSTDDTYLIAQERAAQNSKISVYTKTNGGKPDALNYGWRRSGGEIIVELDADTLFDTRTISALARQFVDEKVGAVAGNAKVGNRLSVVSKWQALEYVTSQNFDRRAFALLNCIIVVPGCVGAWRRSVLEDIGGFSSDTFNEDQELTIQVLKRGHIIGYAEDAIGLTEAPDSLRTLARQRFRWSFGTLQCIWKHKDALFNPKYGTLGFIAMPNVWIFQVFFPLVSPLIDLMFIGTLASVLITSLEHQQGYAHTPSNFNQVIGYYLLFLGVDLLCSFVAFLMEEKEQKSLLFWVLIQRFGYRQVMYWVMVKSVYTAIRGSLVGWGKLERKATVGANA